MKKLFFLIMIASQLLNAQGRIFTLEESITEGLKASSQLKIAQSKINFAEAQADQINSQLFPQLKLNASYFRLSDVPPFEISLPVLQEPVVIQEPVLNNYSIRLSLQQPLFTGFRLSSLKSAAKLSAEAYSVEYSKEVNEEAFKIIHSFWNFQRAKIYKQAVENNVLSAEAYLNDTRRFLENDLVTMNDLLKLEVQHSNSKLKLIEAENALLLARTSFNKALALSLPYESDIMTEQIYPQNFTLSLEEIIQEAKTNREELKAASLRIEAGKETITAANSTWFPSIYLTSSYNYSRPNTRIFPLQDKFNDSWDAGVTLSWEIFNWGNSKAQVRQSEENLIQIETAKNQIEDAIEIEIYRNYLEVTSSLKKIDVSSESLNQSKENLRLTREKYKEQLASSADLIDAENSFLQAETGFNSSLIDYELARLRLLKSIGRKIF
jgi:outer membrane protein